MKRGILNSNYRLTLTHLVVFKEVMTPQDFKYLATFDSVSLSELAAKTEQTTTRDRMIIVFILNMLCSLLSLSVSFYTKTF